MATTIAGPRRPPLSAEFMTEQRRQRLIFGLATAVSERTYEETTVADVVRAAGVARNTFYNSFTDKARVATALMEKVCPKVSRLLSDASDHSGVWSMAVEIAASLRLGRSKNEIALEIQSARRILTVLAGVEPSAETAGEDPYLCTLPPGCHGLSPAFVTANQRRRLSVGFATAVVERGYGATTIADIARHAAVSRRTFYEHFASVGDCASTFLEECGVETSETACGINAVAVEIAAAAFLGDDSLDARRRLVSDVLDALASSPAAV